MFEQERSIAYADQEWKEWFSEIPRRASMVIATTRYAWMSCVSASPSTDAIELDCAVCEHPLFRRAMDANSHRRVVRLRAVRIRSVRRA